MDDVRALLARVADDVSGVTPPTDLLRRGRSRARARTGLATAAAVLAVSAVATLLPWGDHPAPQPATATCRAGTPTAAEPCTAAVDSATGLPVYSGGGRMLEGTALSGRAGNTATFTFTPSSWSLALVSRCTPVKLLSGRFLGVTVNGFPTAGGGCGFTTRADLGQDRAYWERLGVRLGRETTIKVTISGPITLAGGPASRPVLPGSATRPPAPTQKRDPDDDAIVRLGIYQGVPREEYPFPPAPASITAPPPLTKTFNGAHFRELSRMRLPDANGTWSVRVPSRERLALYAAANAPGEIRVSINGKLVGGRSFWTYHSDPATAYSMNEYAVHLDPGYAPLRPTDRGPVTVTVEARGFQYRAWTVQLVHVGP